MKPTITIKDVRVDTWSVRRLEKLGYRVIVILTQTKEYV